MKSYRPSRRFLVWMVPMLAGVVGGAWALSKTNDSPAREPQSEGGLTTRPTKLLRSASEDDRDSPAARKAMRESCAGWKERMLQEFPGLRAEEKPVPDEENAFLQLYLLSGSGGGQAPEIGEALAACLTADAAWDSAIVREALAGEAELVALAEKFGSMTKSSTAHMPEDYVGFISARFPKALGDILMLKARLAGEDQQPEEALRLVRAARNLASHFQEVEEPSLLFATVSILVDLNTTATSFQHLLPTLGPAADLAAWKEALAPRGYGPAEFANLMRGDWSTGSEFFLYPGILRQKPADGEALARLYAANFEKIVKDLPGMSWAEFAEGSFLRALDEGVSGLSAESQEMLRALSTGHMAWNKGYQRATSVTALHEAALDLLILEQGGATLSAESVALLKVDPVSGQSYRFDPASRTLSAPEVIEAKEVKPAKLPW